MAVLQIIYGYKAIFKEKASIYKVIDEEAKSFAKDLLDTMYYEKAVGLGANMVGIAKSLIVVDLFENHVKNPIVAFNPEVIYRSSETQKIEEASISFPGVSAIIERPSKIKIKYLDEEGSEKEKEAEGFLSSVLQHEIDYLNGVTIFDHMTKMKKDMMLKRMDKLMKSHPPHIHGPSCEH